MVEQRIPASVLEYLKAYPNCLFYVDNAGVVSVHQWRPIELYFPEEGMDGLNAPILVTGRVVNSDGTIPDGNTPTVVKAALVHGEWLIVHDLKYRKVAPTHFMTMIPGYNQTVEE